MGWHRAANSTLKQTLSSPAGTIECYSDIQFNINNSKSQMVWLSECSTRERKRVTELLFWRTNWHKKSDNLDVGSCYAVVGRWEMGLCNGC